MRQTKIDSILRIPYDQRTPAQRWAVLCYEERDKRGWVQRELADKLNATISAVTAWESGKYYPRNEYIYAFANLTMQSPEQVIAYLNNTPVINNSHGVKTSADLLDLAAELKSDDLEVLIKSLISILVEKSTESKTL